MITVDQNGLKATWRRLGSASASVIRRASVLWSRLRSSKRRSSSSATNRIILPDGRRTPIERWSHAAFPVRLSASR
jgi:hypothetical protein